MASDRLNKAVRDELTRLGDKAVEKLTLKSDVSATTIRSVRDGHMPRQGTAIKLLRACGVEESVAIEIAQECDPDEGRETA